MGLSRISQLWDQYCDAERDRIRSVSLQLLEELITELLRIPPDDKSAWALRRSYEAVDIELGPPVRFPLFREILFPALLEGVRSGQPGCARWLAGLYPLLYKSPGCIAELEEWEKGESGLLRLAIQADPQDRRARSSLIALLAREFEYSLHELPVGVLYGQNGASVDQCSELSDELAEFEDYIAAEGRDLEFVELVARCRYHFREYPKYLEQVSEFGSYVEYLERQ